MPFTLRDLTLPNTDAVFDIQVDARPNVSRVTLSKEMKMGSHRDLHVATLTREQALKLAQGLLAEALTISPDRASGG